MNKANVLQCYSTRADALRDNHPDKAVRWGNSLVGTPPGVAPINARIAMPQTTGAELKGNKSEILPNLFWATHNLNPTRSYTRAVHFFQDNGWVVVAPSVPGRYILGSRSSEQRDCLENGRQITILPGPSSVKGNVTRELIVGILNNGNDSSSNEKRRSKSSTTPTAVAVVSLSDMIADTHIQATYASDTLAGKTFHMRIPFCIDDYAREPQFCVVRDEHRGIDVRVRFVYPMAVQTPLIPHGNRYQNEGLAKIHVHHNQSVAFLPYVLGFIANLKIQNTYPLAVAIPPLAISKTINVCHVTKAGVTIHLAVHYKATLEVERTIKLKPGSERHKYATTAAKALLKTLTTPEIPPFSQELHNLSSRLPPNSSKRPIQDQKTPESSRMHNLLRAVQQQHETLI